MAQPKFTVYTAPFSHNGVRPELALREKGLAFDVVHVDLLAGEHRRPPLSELTPRGQVPTLVYDAGGEAVVVWESIAIVRFIDAVAPEPPLMPPVAERRRYADALMRIEEFQAKLDPKNIMGSVLFARQGREQLAPRIEALRAELPRWDAYVKGRRFLAGEQFTLADIAVFPLLMHFEALGYDWARHTPSLGDYIGRCKDRPSVRASGWLEHFSRFVRQRAPEPVLAT
jgi:glutathione S-transferase